MFTKNTKLFAIVAKPVEHSLSPFIHTNFARQTNTKLKYIKVLPRGSLKATIKELNYLGFVGMNISLPYKKEIFSCVENIDKASFGSLSINTLKKNSLNRYDGYNTDVDGLYLSLIENSIFLKGEDVIILAFGGVASSLIYLCIREKVKSITILTRDIKKTRLFLESILKNSKYLFSYDADNIQYESISKDLNLLISIKDKNKLEFLEDERDKYLAFHTSPLGMYKNTELYIENPSFYRACKFAYDFIYTPLKTVFMKEFEKRNKLALSGLDMLINQASYSFSIWNGISINKEFREDIKSKIYKLGENIESNYN